MNEKFGGEMINNQETPKYKEAITNINQAFNRFVVENNEMEKENKLDKAI